MRCARCSFWGDALKWGDQNRVDSAEQCCESCAKFRPESQWADQRECNSQSEIFFLGGGGLRS